MTATVLPKRSMPVDTVLAQESMLDAATLTQAGLPLTAGGSQRFGRRVSFALVLNPPKFWESPSSCASSSTSVNAISPRSQAVCLVSKYSSSCSGTLVIASSAAPVRALRGSRSQFRQGSRRWLLSGDGHGDPLGTYRQNFSSPAVTVRFCDFFLRLRRKALLPSSPAASGIRPSTTTTSCLVG